MAMYSLPLNIKLALGKFWRSYIVDECPEGDWELLKDMNLKRSIIWQPPYKHRSFLAIMPGFSRAKLAL
jgi:hypothetical protein